MERKDCDNCSDSDQCKSSIDVVRCMEKELNEAFKLIKSLELENIKLNNKLKTALKNACKCSGECNET